MRRMVLSGAIFAAVTCAASGDGRRRCRTARWKATGSVSTGVAITPGTTPADDREPREAPPSIKLAGVLPTFVIFGANRCNRTSFVPIDY